MRLYSGQDVQDHHYLLGKYNELIDEAERLMKEEKDKIGSGIKTRFALNQVAMAKDMMDSLGTEVPDDKAVALGFGK